MLIANGIKDILQPNIDPDYGANGSVIPAIYYTLIFLGMVSCLSLDQGGCRREKATDPAPPGPRGGAAGRTSPVAPATRFALPVQRAEHVAMEIPEEPDTALEMIHRDHGLSALFCSRTDASHLSALDEIEAMLAYIRIQELRFEGRLDLVVEVDPRPGRSPCRISFCSRWWRMP